MRRPVSPFCGFKPQTGRAFAASYLEGQQMRELVVYGGAIITSDRHCPEPEIYDSFPSMRGWGRVVFEVLKRAIAGTAEYFDARRA